MDPFTISTGVAGFLSLAIEIISILNGYIGDVNSAPKDANELLAEINALKLVLEQLIRFLRSDEAKKVKFDDTAILCTAIQACQAKIEDLYKTLRGLEKTKDNKVRGIIERPKWPFRKEECQRIVEELHRFARTFEFSLSVSNWLV
jgi:hypothetical protein